LPIEPGRRELELVAETMLRLDSEQELVAELLLPPAPGKTSPGSAQARLKQLLPKLDGHGLTRLIVALDLSQECDEWHGDAGRLEAIAALYKVDPTAIKATLKSEAKAAEKAQAEKPANAKKGAEAAA
jgi:hypothetical protein